MTNARGIDVSAYQVPLSAATLAGLDFAYTKATEGTSIIDANLAGNWRALGAWGKPRGVYHEFRPAVDASAQANYCHAAVSAAGGLQPGDMAAVVASDYAGTTGAEIAEWCTTTQALAGPQVRVVIYSDLSVLPQLGACTGWPLWVAWPNGTPPAAGQLAPWTRWTFWQNGISGTDTDQFNGTAADLAAWINGGNGKMAAIIVWGQDKAYLLDGGRAHVINSDGNTNELLMYQQAGVPSAGGPEQPNNYRLTAAQEALFLADFPPGNPAVTVNVPPVTANVVFPTYTSTPS